MRTLLYMLVTAALLVSCTREVEVDWGGVPGGSNYVLEYGKGAIPRQKKLKLRETEQEVLRTYLQDFVRDASPTVVTYAPGMVLSGERYTLNFLREGDGVVLGIRRREKDASNTQLFRKRTEADTAMEEMLRKRISQRSLIR